MKVLVVSASKHGATEEIAAGIVLELRGKGIDAVAKTAVDPVQIDGFDAVILGSAIYAGHWMKEAIAFIEQHQRSLADKPVWLFSSGPVGDGGGREPMAADYAAKLVADSGAREHKIFAGKLDPNDLNLAEKAITKIVRAPSGDFRDWDAIHAWARGIADQLLEPAGV